MNKHQANEILVGQVQDTRRVGMNMDWNSVSQALTEVGRVLALLKQAKDLLPSGTKKDEINQAIESAERQMKLAESKTAQGLGYVLCKNHFPPEIMLSSDERTWKCSVCDNEKTTGMPDNNDLRENSKWKY